MRTALIGVVIVVAAVAAYVFLGGMGTAQTQTAIIGKWQSTQDSKFIREFANDGKVIDAYEGSEPDSSGRWAIFTKAMPVDGIPGEVVLEERAVYLSIGFPRSESLYFKISKIDSDNLELIYLNRGGVLSFTRAK